MVRTVDTDVVVLAIAMFNQIGADELRLAFETRSNFRYIPVHVVVAGMDPRICATLPVFHALTGCDTVSAFSGRGKIMHGIHGTFFPKSLKHLKTSFSCNRT